MTKKEAIDKWVRDQFGKTGEVPTVKEVREQFEVSKRYAKLIMCEIRAELTYDEAT